jgi:hypothetical protein
MAHPGRTSAQVAREATDRRIRGGRASVTTPTSDSRPLASRGRSQIDYLTQQDYGWVGGEQQPAFYGRAVYGGNAYHSR